MVYFNDSLKTHKQPMNNADRLIIPTNAKSQLERRLNAKQCEYCGENDRIEVHHVRKLKDVIKKYLKRGNMTPKWALIMAGLRRKTLVLCQDCHIRLHQGTLDGKTAII